MRCLADGREKWGMMMLWSAMMKTTLPSWRTSGHVFEPITKGGLKALGDHATWALISLIITLSGVLHKTYDRYYNGMWSPALISWELNDEIKAPQRLFSQLSANEGITHPFKTKCGKSCMLDDRERFHPVTFYRLHGHSTFLIVVRLKEEVPLNDVCFCFFHHKINLGNIFLKQ